MKLRQDELELIERLVRHDRTAVSSALLAIAGIGAGEAIRGAVLARVERGGPLGTGPRARSAPSAAGRSPVT